MKSLQLDAAGRRRSAATPSGYHCGRPPRSKGLCYPADPPSVEEIVAVMRTGGSRLEGARLRGLMVVLWRSGLRISEALGLAENDLDWNRGRRVVDRGQPRPLEPNSAASRRSPVFGGASRHISCAMRTLLRWREKVCRWW
jgi:integrase